jgi:hypothetical protein
MSAAKCTCGRQTPKNRRTEEPTGAVVWFFGSLVLWSFAAAAAQAAEPPPFSERLDSLAVKRDELGLKEQAEITRGWVIPRHAGRQYLFLPAAMDSTAPKAGAPETVRQWHKRFLELRREQADVLYVAAKAACDERRPARAYQLLYEVVREDPDHAEARRILGYVKSGNEWRLPDSEKAVLRQPPFAHPKTGWPVRGYWSLETSHFHIVSNDSGELKEAEKQLENLHALWRQIFFRYWSTPETLARSSSCVMPRRLADGAITGAAWTSPTAVCRSRVATSEVTAVVPPAGR